MIIAFFKYYGRFIIIHIYKCLYSLYYFIFYIANTVYIKKIICMFIENSAPMLKLHARTNTRIFFLGGKDKFDALFPLFQN